MTDYTRFRQQLDTVLRTRNLKQVQDFLLAEKQWQVGQPANPEFAMWMVATLSEHGAVYHERITYSSFMKDRGSDLSVYANEDLDPYRLEIISSSSWSCYLSF